MARRVRLAGRSELTPGQARWVLNAGPPPYRSFLVVGTETGPKAYWNVCQHLPVPLDGGMMVAPVEGPDLVCNTHGARYSIDSGICHTGPCEGERLVEVPIEVDGDDVFGLVADDGRPLSE